MENHIIIRKAVVHDLNGILELFKGTVVAVCSKDYTPQQLSVWLLSADNKARWVNAIKSQYFIIAEKNGIMAGFASLDENYIDFMYVHKNFQKQGIAGALYAKLKNEAAGLGKSCLFSDVSSTAVPFFKSKGFSIVKEQVNNIGDIAITNFKMFRPLLSLVINSFGIYYLDLFNY